jgi:DNA-binding HxlR family transcriptional regulator
VPVRRTYGDQGDACRAALALDIVGDRWSLIVVRELILGPRRFSDLQSALIGVSPAVLSERLRSLRAAGVVEQIELADFYRGRAYALTDWGRGLEGVLKALGQWMSTGPGAAEGGGMTPDAIVVAMRTMLGDIPARTGTVRIALRLRDVRRPSSGVRDFQLVWSRRSISIGAGLPAAPDATVSADSTAWGEVLFDGVKIASAARRGLLTVQGDESAVAEFVAIFVM